MKSFYRKQILPRLLNSEMGAEDLMKIRKEVLVDAVGITLEIGVGPGYNISIYKNISKLYALEPSKELVEIAKKRADGSSFPIEFLNSSAESIPLPDNSVDTTVSTWTLCSVSDLPKALSEIKRVLKPGGKFVFFEHGASPKPFTHFLQKFFTSITKYFTGNCHYDRNIEIFVKRAGFVLDKIEYSRKGLMPLIYNYKGVGKKPIL